MNEACQSESSSSHSDERRVWQVLAEILDPEFGVNIVDLGLIYSVCCARGEVEIVMTLTTPSCPAATWIYEGIKAALAALPGITQVTVSLVFDPPWSAAMLSDSARRQLGGSPA